MTELYYGRIKVSGRDRQTDRQTDGQRAAVGIVARTLQAVMVCTKTDYLELPHSLN